MNAEDESKSLIAGIACRLPKSSNLQEFWENLIESHDMIDTTRFPEGLEGVPPRAGLIPDIDKFDAEYFGFTDVEADNMNVMLRHLLEVTYECIVDSGLQEKTFQDNVTGLYLACFLPDTDPIETTKYSNSKLCTTTPLLTGHITSYFGWKGPAVSVDTACSSSLSALEMAETDLRTGRCQFAVVASVNLIINPVYLQQMAVLGMLNPTGESKVFDRDAGGYVRAEGVAAIILTRRETLCRRIYATLVDVMTNCDGYTPEGISFPNDLTQKKLLQAIYKRAGVESDQLAYMELHSTGTKVGDKVEIGAVTDVLSPGRSTPLPVGSVKGNMGHSEATAGMASLMKCLLVARHRKIPSQLNYVNPNPRISAVQTGKVEIINQVTPLKDGYIGLNSFGFGGANGHLILKPYRKDRKENDQKLCLLPYKARTMEEVEAICKLSESDLSSRIDIHGLLAGSVLSHDEKRPIKGYLISSRHTEETVCGWTLAEDKGKTKVGKVGLFLPNFIWEPVLVDKEILDIPSFSTSLQKSQQILTEKLGWSFSLVDKIRSDELLTTVTAENLCLVIATQIGMINCIEESHVPISYMAGSGLSEITVAYLDGCLTQEQCLHVALVLGKALQEFSDKQELPDKVYKVHLPLEKVYLLGPKIKVLASPSMETSIILVNTQFSNQILKDIHEKGGFYKELQQKIPFHSHYMINCFNSILQSLEDIIKNPKQSSSRFLQRKHDFLPGLESRSVAFSAKYLMEMFTRTCPPFKAAIPSDMVMVSINLNGQTEEADETIINADSKHELTTIQMESNPVTVLQALGEVFLHGHDIKVAHLYKTDFPLDVSAPALSPVIHWNHDVSWYIPEWHEFFNKVKDVGLPTYIIDTKNTEDMTTPMALLVYHTWRAITQRHKALTKDNVVAVEIQSLAVHNEAVWSAELLSGAAVNIQELQKNFTITKQGLVLLTGSFKIHTENIELPRIPGFDLDINQNVDPVRDDEEEIQKTEILWEDSWLDFINTALEFTIQSLVGPLTRVIIHPGSHSKEVENCANILTVAERVTGLCKAGNGLVFQTLVTQAQRELQAGHPRMVNISDGEHTLVNMAMAYGVQGSGQSYDQVLLYQGTNTLKDINVIGVVLITDEETVCREIPIDERLDQEEMQQLTPYILAHYITTTVAEVTRGDKVLVSHPIDTVAVYIMAIVEELGGVIFVSSYDPEIRHMLDRAFPYARVLSASNMLSNVKSVTQGEGCDICIKFTSGELDEVLSLVSLNGKMIQCSPMLDSESLDLSFLSKNASLKLPTMTEAFKVLTEKSMEDIDEMLYDLRHGNVVKLTSEGFPEAKGLLYGLEEHASFVSPVPFPKLLTVLEEPRIGLMESFEEMVMADVMAMEKLHNFVMSKPKDYSLAEMGLNSSRDGLNAAMNPTPASDSTEFPSASPGICVISLNNISLESSPPGPPTPYPSKVNLKPKVDQKMTSTPMITITESEDKVDNLHESYIEPCVPAPTSMSNKLQVKGAKGPYFLSPLSLSGISNFKPNKPKGHQVDLLFVGPPRTPMTPAIQDMLTPSSHEPTVVPLNTVHSGSKTVFMIHPITGKLTLLRKLGENLMVPVYGIQRTCTTPRDSIHSVASYYLNAIQMMGVRDDDHYIIGYSFGAIVAIEMAIQLQACGKKVADLILLDGAPNLLQSQMQDSELMRAKGKTDEQISTLFEVGSLMSYMYMFKPIENPSLTRKILANLPTKAARIDTVVDMTFGNVNIGASPRHTKWLTAKHKILKKLKEPSKNQAKYGMADAAQELIRLKRVEAASDHIKSIQMVYNFRPNHNRRFDGNIYLLRIKSDPLFLTHHLSPDYDLHDWCTGKVQIKFYDGTHESFLSGMNAPNVAKDITEILSKL